MCWISRACPNGQIRGSLVIVLVLAMADCQELQLSFHPGVLSLREVISFRRGANLTPRVRGCWQ